MFFVVLAIVLSITIFIILEKEYKELEAEVLEDFGFSGWDVVSYFDAHATVKSRQALERYDDVKFFRDNNEEVPRAEEILARKHEVARILRDFLEDNPHRDAAVYRRLEKQIHAVLDNVGAYRIHVEYITPAGNYLGEKTIHVTKQTLNKFYQDPALLVGKGEYNKYLREQQREALGAKQQEYYKRVNGIIDFANENREKLILKGSQERLDSLIAQLFDRTVHSIKKVRTPDSEEWNFIGDFMTRIQEEVGAIVGRNRQLLDYYGSEHFRQVRESCQNLVDSQREFNEYITEKVEAVSKLFGTRVVRSETIHMDEYHYIRPYKKTITPFTAEVSAAVFASAENKPLEYVVKHFYPNRGMYPEQIRKLYVFIEELETLRDAKGILDNYKAEYRQYLGDVPAFVMEHDEAGFYSRLGFANIDESVFAVEYKFAYTSRGGMAQRSFAVPMTQETIVELIQLLQSKLTASAFAREQRALMTKKLRESIKQRDDFTCRRCGNSTHAEPNLLLEIDHIIPVSKGGCTEESNLQTLCWKCNRAKGDKIDA